MNAAERKRADAYAGPHQSFPLYSSGAHLKAAWDLAGHSADPDATRAKIRAFARRHGLTRLLPSTAKAMTDDTDDKPASRTAGLVQLAFSHAKSADGEYGSFHRRSVVEHAQKNGLAKHLPDEAHGFMHEHAMDHDHGDGKMSHSHPVKKALPAVSELGAAVGAGHPEQPGRHVAAVLDAAFDLALDADQGKPGEQVAHLIRFAQENGLTRFLPERAENAARATDSGVKVGRIDSPLPLTQTPPGDVSLPAGTPSAGDASTPAGASDSGQVVGRVDDPLAQGNPPGDVTEPGTVENPLPSGSGAQSQAPGAISPVAKGFTLIKPGTIVMKGQDGTCIVEGWVSTDEEDSEHDIVPPEAFLPSIDGYAARRMPLSSNHAMKALPIGHGQKVALVRDGKVLKSAKHPSDSAEFEAFPGTGTGVYGRFLITDPQHASHVRKGNIGGFSWVGNLTEYEPRSGAGRTFKRVDPWLESTLAAYPINDTAVVTTAKAEEL